MQPFDALTMRAVLQEARPVLLNRKVEKIHQLGRDEVVIALRSKAGTAHLQVSAQASFGRICLALNPPLPKAQNMPPFCQLLRKHLSSATLTGLEQLPGERVVDLIFAASDEIGNRFTRVLTAEIMGRHSNLILWDKDTEMILGASHNVTQEMSRQREIACGLRYVRPPRQDKPGLFDATQDQFKQAAHLHLQTAPGADRSGADQPPVALDQWLLNSFAGLGRHLAEELIDAAGLSATGQLSESGIEALWQRVASLQSITNYTPAMRTDLSSFSVLCWWRETNGSTEQAQDWQSFPSANDLVDAYFRGIQLRTEIQQLRERIKSELKTEEDKLRTRLDAAAKLLNAAHDHEKQKRFGDLILANLAQINSGQTELNCTDLFSAGEPSVCIPLNANLSGSQNAQSFYRQYAKGRTRTQAAQASWQDASGKLAQIQDLAKEVEKATTLPELQVFKERIVDRGRKPETPRQTAPKERTPAATRERLLSFKSSDGYTVIVGRNRNENDYLIAKLTQAHDIWMHAQGLEGAHVVVKVPNKKDPPASTLKEAAQAAARFAKAGLGGKIRVIYTLGKYVRKIAKDKPGLVRYENEKTIEVDTTAPMPPAVRKLFS